MLDSWRASKNSHWLTTFEDRPLVIVLPSETLNHQASGGELTYVGIPGGARSDFKDLSSRRSPGFLCSVASGLSLVMGITATSLFCCWEVTTGPTMRETSTVPGSGYGRLLVMMMEKPRNQEAGKTPRPTCVSFLMVLPTAVSQAPSQPLMSSAGKAVRKISTQARNLGAWLSPAKCFQLVLGNWCQLLGGALLGTSWAVGRWALDCSQGLA